MAEQGRRMIRSQSHASPCSLTNASSRPHFSHFQGFMLLPFPVLACYAPYLFCSVKVRQSRHRPLQPLGKGQQGGALGVFWQGVKQTWRLNDKVVAAREAHAYSPSALDLPLADYLHVIATAPLADAHGSTSRPFLPCRGLYTQTFWHFEHTIQS